MTVSPLWLGVDIAGADNTWIAVLEETRGGLRLADAPTQAKLTEIRDLCLERDVLGVAIDAPLTAALEHERGMRPGDMRLRDKLPQEHRNWVASFNSLMAVPVRGQLLAEALAPLVGTVLETHPRAGMLAVLGQDSLGEIAAYKVGDGVERSVSTLWRAWLEAFAIETDHEPSGDGALDALVCATVAWAYHRTPERLEHLRNPGGALRGVGPFYVFEC